MATKNSRRLIMGNIVDTIALSILSGSSLNMQVTRSGIKSRKSSISLEIGLFALESLALESRIYSHRLIMEKILWTQ